jgi:hypothetical protein
VSIYVALVVDSVFGLERLSGIVIKLAKRMQYDIIETSDSIQRRRDRTDKMTCSSTKR